MTKPNKALHLTAIPLRFIAEGELDRQQQAGSSGCLTRPMVVQRTLWGGEPAGPTRGAG